MCFSGLIFDWLNPVYVFLLNRLRFWFGFWRQLCSLLLASGVGLAYSVLIRGLKVRPALALAYVAAFTGVSGPLFKVIDWSFINQYSIQRLYIFFLLSKVFVFFFPSAEGNIQSKHQGQGFWSLRSYQRGLNIIFSTLTLIKYRNWIQPGSVVLSAGTLTASEESSYIWPLPFCLIWTYGGGYLESWR